MFTALWFTYQKFLKTLCLFQTPIHFSKKSAIPRRPLKHIKACYQLLSSCFFEVFFNSRRATKNKLSFDCLFVKTKFEIIFRFRKFIPKPNKTNSLKQPSSRQVRSRKFLSTMWMTPEYALKNNRFEICVKLFFELFSNFVLMSSSSLHRLLHSSREAQTKVLSLYCQS